MNTIMIIVPSLLEMIFTYVLLVALGQENYRGKLKAIIFCLSPLIYIMPINYFQVPYHIFITVFFDILILKLLTKNKLLNVTIDVIIAFGILSIMEIMGTVIYGFVGIDIINNPLLQVGTLLGYVIIATLLKLSRHLDIFLEHFYRVNRPWVLWIGIDIMAFYVLFSNFWIDADIQLQSAQVQIFILMLFYVAINIFLIFSILRYLQKKNELKNSNDYQRHLEELAGELSRRQHEYKNQVNVLIGLAEQRQGDRSLQKIIEFGEDIIRREKEQPPISIISDNSVISAFIYRMNKQADQKNIQFMYQVDKPFPSYPIPGLSLTELLSNLMNNAFDAVMNVEEDLRQVILICSEHEIEIANYVGSQFQASNIVKFQRSGYSTKGYGRGYGMTNVFRIVNKYKIKTDIYLKGQMLVFTLSFNAEESN